jgi:hypothetical protein
MGGYYAAHDGAPQAVVHAWRACAHVHLHHGGDGRRQSDRAQLVDRMGGRFQHPDGPACRGPGGRFDERSGHD